jgi:hypothetical protein
MALVQSSRPPNTPTCERIASEPELVPFPNKSKCQLIKNQLMVLQFKFKLPASCSRDGLNCTQTFDGRWPPVQCCRK